MKLSIIIVNYKSGDLTHSCIESLFSQKLNFSFEIIVVDNNSRDDSVSFLRADFPEITVLANTKNVGLAEAVNKAIKQAKGEYYLVLNPDVIALPGSVNALLEYVENNKKVGMAGGQLLSTDGSIQNSCFRFYRPITILYRRTWLGKTAAGIKENNRFLMKDFDHKTVRDVEWIMGSCMLMRREAIEEAGGMDARFFLYFEDVDWCRRIWEAGWRVSYVPQARFSHFHQQSSRQNSFWGVLKNWTVREHIKSAIKYFLKYRGKKLPFRDKMKAE